jgi:hypothetical protein
MNKILVLLITFFTINTLLMAEDVVLLAAKLKIDAYSPKDMSYLGKFADLKTIMKPTCMAISKDGKLIVAGTALPQTDKKNIIIKLNTDGDINTVEYLFSQDALANPIDTPKSIVELDDGSLVVFDQGKKDLFKFSATGEFQGTFLQAGVNQADYGTISSIFKYGSDVVVTSSDPNHKLVEYDSTGAFVTNLTDGNGYIRTPFHVSKTSNGYIMVALGLVEVNGVEQQTSTLLQLDNDLLFVKKLISDSDIEKKSLLRPRFALKNEETGQYLIIDEGRSRASTVSYDDNLELFSSTGVYEKSLGTYEDTLLRYILLFNGSTKKWDK